MQVKSLTCKILFFALFLIGSTFGFSQNNKLKALENRRIELRKEIKEINALLSKNKNKQRSQLSIIETINKRVNTLKNLIKVTNQQANYITREIRNNQKKISQLRNELKLLKTSYSQMIVKTYKSKNKQSKIMFLLSSNNFKQAYKRVQYLNQYAKYQKQQGEKIKLKTEVLQKLNTDLLTQKTKKKALISENNVSKKTLENELDQHQVVMRAITKNLSKYSAQIKEKQREFNRIDKRIEKTIREAIAKSNKKAGKKGSNAFTLTPEGKALASNFVSNKGKLPWPVAKGKIKVHYGKQRHPIVKTVTFESRGVRIATEQGALVRSVFNGIVSSIQVLKRGNLLVLIQHGNYITAYKGLSEVKVKKGDIIKTKQVIGRVFTNPSSGESVLYFGVYKESKTQDPETWIKK